ncbi:MAG: hypothetical protein ABI759_28625 [Candidatus Solibacter sp.]
MKLRLQTNSLRLRLTRPEVERLHAGGIVEEVLAFADGATFSYRLQSRLQSAPPEAVCSHASMTVYLSREDAERWATSEEVGLYGASGGVAIAIEKDFRCLVPRPGEAESGAYPHPGKS